MSNEEIVNNIPLSVDYTSRDYTSLREDLIARIQDSGRLPNWRGEDPADFGLVLVESFAYLGDLMSYYIDRIANETAITTAVKPSSVYALANSYGYKPVGYRQSTVTITVSYDTEDELAASITLPEGTVFTGEYMIGDAVNQVYFTSNSDITIDPNSTETVQATHGQSITLYPITTENPSINDETYGELLDISEGKANMAFTLSESPVVDGTVEIFVKDGSAYTQWTRVDYLMDYGPTDLVYTTFFTDDQTYYVQFGDGVSGAVPPSNSLIQARYIVGGGTVGNIPVSTINEITYVPGLTPEQTILPDITVTNAAEGVGGFNPESLSEIRLLAPLSYRTNSRAVTLQDFESLALSTPNVSKAKAVATSPTAVTLYVAPTRSATDDDSTPGIYNAGTEGAPNYQPTQELINLKNAVSSFISDKMMIGTTLTLANPTYVELYLSITYKKLDQYETQNIEPDLIKDLLLEYNYAFATFGQTIYPQDIEAALQSSTGVRYLKVTRLSRTTTGLNTIVGASNEILKFVSAKIALTEE